MPRKFFTVRRGANICVSKIDNMNTSGNTIVFFYPSANDFPTLAAVLFWPTANATERVLFCDLPRQKSTAAICLSAQRINT